MFVASRKVFAALGPSVRCIALANPKEGAKGAANAIECTTGRSDLGEAKQSTLGGDGSEKDRDLAPCVERRATTRLSTPTC